MPRRTTPPTKGRILTVMLAVALAGYAALCLGARAFYPRLLFQPPRRGTLAKPGDPDAKLVELAHANGSRTIGLHYPAPRGTDARTVVVFHGNGETIFDNEDHAAELKRRGLGVFLVEYRGYGPKNEPLPSEAMLYEDGEAAIAYLARENVAPDRLAIWGWSLGSGVATEMAHRGHGARLLLLSPFTSIIDMGRRFAPFLPVSWLMKHRLDSLAKAPAIRQPTLVVHGDADELIPFAMGEKLARAFPSAALLRVEGGHHADLLYAGSSRKPDAAALFDRIARHLAE